MVQRGAVFVAVVGVRAYPQAVVLQLLIKTRFPDGRILDFAPYTRRPGKFEFGAELRDPIGLWQPATAHFAGGDGGEGLESGTGGNYEFKWWVPFSGTDRGIRLWCVWQELDIPKSTAELDFEHVLIAACGSRPIWTA